MLQISQILSDYTMSWSPVWSLLIYPIPEQLLENDKHWQSRAAWPRSPDLFQLWKVSTLDFFRECNPHDSACCLNKVHAFLIWQSNLGKCWGQPVLESDRGKPGRVRSCWDTKGLGSLALWTQLTGHRHGRDKVLVCRAPRKEWLSFVTEVSLGSTGWSGTCCANGAGTM